MAGIYIHIPFCRQACHYCDFHFSTNLTKQQQMVDAICKEIDRRSDYLSEPINTIYFGGGTPSLLKISEVEAILDKLHHQFSISSNPEITFEANPEDLDIQYCKELRSAGVNRLSIGFQTFENNGLEWMNRAHDAQKAEQSFEHAREAGFENISIDLIYALPKAKEDRWHFDLKKALTIDPEHISLYGLTIEERTVFGKRKKDGQLIELPEEKAAEQYLFAIEHLTSFGYQLYEVSNFAKSGYESKHNTAYWSGVEYLGIGPGAHSFNGHSRQFNIRNNPKYLKSMEVGDQFYEIETLTEIQKLNEHILTSLRKANGLSLATASTKFGVDVLKDHREVLTTYKDHALLVITNDSIRLTAKGFLVADDVALQLFYDEPE